MKKSILLLSAIAMCAASSMSSATVKFGYNPQNPSNGKDMPLGMALAASVGKKVAVSIDADNVSRVFIITDEFWNGSKK